MNKNVSINELIKNNYLCNIVDIRSIEKYNDNHIPNAINIPYDNLKQCPEKYLVKNKKYFIYCKQGKQSFKLVTYLNKLGYITYSVIGGYEAWILSK